MLTLQLGLGCEAGEAGGLPGSLHGDERQDQAVDILPRLLLKLAAVEYPPAKGNDPGVNPMFYLLETHRMFILSKVLKDF